MKKEELLQTDVDPVESITDFSYDYILIATINSILAAKIIERLFNLGVCREKILTVNISEDRKRLIKRFLDLDSLKKLEVNMERGMVSHA